MYLRIGFIGLLLFLNAVLCTANESIQSNEIAKIDDLTQTHNKQENEIQANDKLSTFDNTYTAKLYGFSIIVASRLKAREDGTYEFYFNASSFIGSITETTLLKWQVSEQSVVPQQYFYKRTGLGKNRDEELRFDWLNHSVINVKRNTSKAFDATSKIQDSLSYQVQLRQDLIAGKKTFSYNISNGGKIRQYQFEIVGEEILDTPLGGVQTVKVKRTDNKDQSETYAWFATHYQYLLIRLEKEDNGSAYTIYLSKAALNGKAIEHF